MNTTQEFQERIGRIEGLVKKLEAAADPALRHTATDLMECLMELHGAGLDRILEIAAGAGHDELIDSLGGDPLVGSLLVLHGLHPDDFETRVRRGLEKARPLLRSHGARADVLAASEALVHVKIVGEGSADLLAAVREAVIESAPDATEVRIENGKPAAQASGFVPLSNLLAATISQP